MKRRAAAVGAVAVAWACPLVWVVPALAADPAGPPEVYATRAEAIGVQYVVNDSAQFFPYADQAAAHTTGTLESTPDATGYAAVVDPGTIVNGAPGIVGAAGGPEVPGYPGAAITRAGGTEDASAVGAPGLGEARSHSDVSRSEQFARSTGAPAGQPLTYGSTETTTAMFLGDDGLLRATATTFTTGIVAPGITIDSVRSTVTIVAGASGDPVVERDLEVQGLEPGGTPVDLGEGEVLGPVGDAADEAAGAAAGTATVAEGYENRAEDGSVVAASGGVLVTFPIPGSTSQTASAFIGSAAVSLRTGVGPDLSPVGGATTATAGPARPSPATGVTGSAPRPGFATVNPAPRPVAPPASAGAAAPDTSPVAFLSSDDTWLVWLYLFWLALSAALVTTAAKTTLAGRGHLPRPELFD